MSEVKQNKILIAEDEKAYSRALTLKLQKAGFEVVSVSNGEEALAQLAKGGYDLLLCDLIMPKVNGFGVLEQIKKDGVSTKVIILSNLGQVDDENKARSLGAIDFMVKSDTPISDVIFRIQSFFTK